MTAQPSIRIPDMDGSDSLQPGTARLVRGNPTDEELAAIAGTLAVLFEAGVQVDRPRDRASDLTPWQRTQRALRGGPSADNLLLHRYR